MFKLRGRQRLDDCKWYGVDEPQTPEELEKVKEALLKALERHQRRMESEKQINPYGNKHWGGYDY